MDKIELGLKENWKQFTLLVIVNAFVGGMVGLERSILPQIAEKEFHIVAKTIILSFIVVFGVVKAATNYFTGTFANYLGRKKLLTIGWLIGIPVPIILMLAPSWNWIIAANVLLGINQGLTWSTTVVMKIDLVGEKNRGLAMGLNEFAGYGALALVGFSTGWVASQYGLRPYPFYIGIAIALAGFLTSWLFIKDTGHHSIKEGLQSVVPRLTNIFKDTTWKNPNLGSVTQAGLINNLNDGMVWGLFPILFAAKGFTLGEIGIITATYPGVWSISQIYTGKMADHYAKKTLLFWGMLIQGIALLMFIVAVSFTQFIVLSVILGIGTALVYPTFLAAIAENTHPADRPKSIGTFRLWRDLGYAIGAILTGVISDVFNINASILLIGALTIISSFIILYRMIPLMAITSNNNVK
ncbi:MFS transporter [Mucilaginibacter sp.]|jgi:MFS family permease|uniref:MFS transporter n=1 Tax=Mucilaginibacter sp. TaxID=1882438 RepID=UPI00356391F0